MNVRKFAEMSAILVGSWNYIRQNFGKAIEIAGIICYNINVC